MNQYKEPGQSPEGESGSIAKKIYRALTRAAKWPTQCPGGEEINKIFNATILVTKLLLIAIATTSAIIILLPYVLGD